MITIILEDKNQTALESISEPSNETYLIKDEDDPSYSYLSQLCDCATDVFAAHRMEKLIAELTLVKQSLSAKEQVAHVDDIIRLARRCQANEGYTLTFTPFGGFSKYFQPTKIDLPPDFFTRDK